MHEATGTYRFLGLTAGPLVKLFFGLRSYGIENIPEKGPFVLAANHASYLDPFFLGASCPRPIHYIMMRQFYELPLIGWVCRGAGSFPVDQKGPAFTALRRALSVLHDGKGLGIFPEGGRSSDGSLNEARSGVSLLVLRSGYPLIPAAIIGADRAFGKGMVLPRPRKVTVRFGRAIDLPRQKPSEKRSAYLARASAKTMDAIAFLQQE